VDTQQGGDTSRKQATFQIETTTKRYNLAGDHFDDVLQGAEGNDQKHGGKKIGGFVIASYYLCLFKPVKLKNQIKQHAKNCTNFPVTASVGSG
jgi:hypothetical protein